MKFLVQVFGNRESGIGKSHAYVFLFIVLTLSPSKFNFLNLFFLIKNLEEDPVHFLYKPGNLNLEDSACF